MVAFPSLSGEMSYFKVPSPLCTVNLVPSLVVNRIGLKLPKKLVNLHFKHSKIYIYKQTHSPAHIEYHKIKIIHVTLNEAIFSAFSLMYIFITIAERQN